MSLLAMMRVLLLLPLTLCAHPTTTHTTHTHTHSFVLSDVRPSSLVLIDELGKGTEVLSGTALSAGILRHLAGAQAM
jgi:hypothetical protein